MTINDGGTAFPIFSASGETSHFEEDGVKTYCNGLTVRDYFAIRALEVASRQVLYPSTDYCLNLAERAYMIADAMITVRAKDEEDNDPFFDKS